MYADILLFVNFSADFLVLYVLGSILTLNKKLYRLCLGSLLGVVYAFICEVFLYEIPVLCMLWGIVIIPFICITAYKYTSAFSLLKQSCMFLLFSALLDGGMQLMSRILISLAGQTLLKNGMSPVMFTVLSCAVTVLTLGCTLIFKRVAVHDMQKILISTNGVQKHYFELMCDTGNILTDVYTGLLVIVIQKECAKRMNIDVGAYECMLEFGIRYIPVVTAVGNSTFACFKPYSIELIKSKKHIPLNAVVAFDNGGCTYNGADGIIPYQLIQNI